MTIEAAIPQVLGDATLPELEHGLHGQLIRPTATRSTRLGAPRLHYDAQHDAPHYRAIS